MLRNTFIAILCLGALASATAHASSWRYRYGEFLQATVNGLDRMRLTNGLITDTVWLCGKDKGGTSLLRVTEDATSPTNIGLDLLLRVTLFQEETGLVAKAALLDGIRTTLQTLSSLDFHKETGLFYRSYAARNSAVMIRDLSSIDNLHLAYGLWVSSKSLTGDDAALALRLFERMDLSIFYDPASGLIGGNVRYDAATGRYELENYRFLHFGSETRSLYALAAALGLYRKVPGMPERMKDGIRGLTVETARMEVGGKPLDLLRLWDGGAFQMLLPYLLVREERLSASMRQYIQSYASYVESRNHMLPARAHSASAFNVKGLRMIATGIASYDRMLAPYHGHAGYAELVATGNRSLDAHRLQWDMVSTPHAFFLAAAAGGPKFAEALQPTVDAWARTASEFPCACDAQATTLLYEATDCSCSSSQHVTQHEPLCMVKKTSGSRVRMFERDIGWMDGTYVKGSLSGTVVPVQISLDQLMIALSLHKVLSSDGDHAGTRAVASDAEVAKDLAQAYQWIDERLKEAASGR